MLGISTKSALDSSKECAGETNRIVVVPLRVGVTASSERNRLGEVLGGRVAVVGGVEDGRGGIGGGGRGFSAAVAVQVVMRWIKRRAAPPLV